MKFFQEVSLSFMLPLLLGLVLVPTHAFIPSGYKTANVAARTTSSTTPRTNRKNNCQQGNIRHSDAATCRPFPRSSTTSHHHMTSIPIEGISSILPYNVISPHSSILISTVSADIDSIPQDDFGLVFAGGIAVMIGGVVSALIVGFLLESNNSYANVVAESYAQGGDEEFWGRLSSEEQEKAKELMARLKQSKEKQSGVGARSESGEGENKEGLVGSSGVASFVRQDQDVVVRMSESENNQNDKKTKEATSMFSDYDD